MRPEVLTLWIALLGTAIIGLMSLSIVGAVIYSSILYSKAPDTLTNWGGLIIGFFIGNFFNFVRSALRVEPTEKTIMEENTIRRTDDAP